MKTCPRCKQEKESDKFYNDKRYKSGKSTYCKECFRLIAKRSKEKKKQHPEKSLIKQGEENIRKIIERYGH